MVKIAREVSGFIALPLSLPSAVQIGQTVEHYLYLRPHEPKVADEDAPRSLFLVNIPVTATEADLKHLFTTQLAAGRVENVYFAENTPGRGAVVASKTGTSNRKRKRVTAEEIEAGIERYSLPRVWPSEIHSTGATAVIVFVDRSSMEMTLKIARKAAKNAQQLQWTPSAKSQSDFGLQRYTAFNALRYPSRRELLRSVDGYMSAYAQIEEARSRENAKKRQMPDEDGFVTVTRGSKGGIRAEEAKELGERQKEKSRGLEDFYRFQMREQRKERHNDMLSKFEDDKRRIAEMKQRRETG